MRYFIIVSCCILLFANCFESPASKQSTKELSEEAYLEQGQKIARTTFATLSSNLQKAMKEGGVSEAIKYCNLAASPLVDSLEQSYRAEIKRTSLKTRSYDNRPTESEINQLQEYQKQFDAGKALKPVVQKTDNQVVFYAPIQLMSLCEKCHGKVGEQLKLKDYETIQNLYPSDRAINYQSGDLRGMWSISLYEK